MLVVPKDLRAPFNTLKTSGEVPWFLGDFPKAEKNETVCSSVLGVSVT